MSEPTTDDQVAAPAHREYDVAIVGGGIVGLATARELAMRHPRLRVVVLEKDAAIAGQQTGHNSGVLHTGIYYPPGSLKARLCVAGRRELLAFCREQGLAVEQCGKVIVALDEGERPRLEELYRRGVANGVEDLELIGPERLRELEPSAAGVCAIYSPHTGITDFVQVAHAYARQFRERGGEVLTSCAVTSLVARDGGAILAVRRATPGGVTQDELRARYAITCAGLQSDRLAGTGAGGRAVRIVPFRGDYYVLRPERRHMVRGLIYPVPDPRFPFLGVHFTRRLDGEVWAGPNAVLAFAREGYRRSRLDAADLLDVICYRGFWKMAARYWRTGLGEMYRDYVKGAYARALRRYLPGLRAEDLLAGPSGVRAQAVDSEGRLVDDFLIRRGERVIHVQNAPSPAATSSLVIARTIVEEAQQAFDLDAGRLRSV
jgi:(S)-2-hydroxyglutarate dehydrogenase